MRVQPRGIPARGYLFLNHNKPPGHQKAVNRMKNALQRVGAVLSRKEILSLCLMILTADIVAGIIQPSFSLFATSLSASLALIGSLAAIEGLTRIVSSVPVGILSDIRGRKDVMTGGMLCFGLAAFLLTFVQNPYWLFPMRILIGLAMVATFFVGVAYIGDIVSERDRGLVIGLYTTFMGSGFALGSAIGGQVASHWSYAASFRVAALVALAGCLIGRWGLASPEQMPAKSVPALDAPPPPSRWSLLRDHKIAAASIANLGNNMWYSGLVASFFALYADSLGIGQAAIGTMFALRALMSASARLPTGVFSSRISPRKLMIAALGLAAAAIVAISGSADATLLTVLLAIEGVAYGMFLTSGQAYVTQNSSEETRGAAVGIYSTAGGIGSTGGPFILGLIAQQWGLQAVFWAMAVMIVVCIAAVLWLANGGKLPLHRRSTSVVSG